MFPPVTLLNTSFSLKVILSASPLLSLPDLQCLVEGMGQQDKDFLRLLQGGVTELRGREEPKGHTVLILDKVHRHYSARQFNYLSRVHILKHFVFLQFLQRLPWENIACLKSRSVTRMPSLHAVLGHSHLKEVYTLLRTSTCAEFYLEFVHQSFIILNLWLPWNTKEIFCRIAGFFLYL